MNIITEMYDERYFGVTTTDLCFKVLLPDLFYTVMVSRSSEDGYDLFTVLVCFPNRRHFNPVRLPVKLPEIFNQFFMTGMLFTHTIAQKFFRRCDRLIHFIF